MNLDKAIIFDIETVGLLDKINSFKDLHVLACAFKDKEGKWQTKATKEFDDIQKLIGNPNNTLVCHNSICYDIPALEKMGFEFKAQIIDTLSLSYYLYSERDRHGLSEWGEFFGVPKPKIDNWENLSYEEYENRCIEDCKINTNLWIMILTYLRKLYDNDDELIIKTIKYFNFKMTKLRLQEENPIYINLEQCQKNLDYLEEIIKEKETELNAMMPKVPVKSRRTKPKNCFKKDGSLSVAGEKWYGMVNQLGLDHDYDGVIEEITGYKEPNCQAHQQMKDFLLGLGWQPTIFKDGANGKVPQLRDDDKNLCPNLQKLIDATPSLKALDGLSVAQHRSGYLKGFLNHADEEGKASAWASAFTRTLRLKHAAPFANLPKPSATHGKLVRGVMGVKPGYVFFGADLSSIEDKCKQISIYNLDPEYVKSMNTKGWDAHLALGEKAGMFTSDEVQFYKWHKNKGKEDNPYTCPESLINLTEEEQDHLFHKLDKTRATAKTTNYACLPKDNTEILTNRGWKYFSELEKDDLVLGYNESIQQTEFVEIEKVHEYIDAEVISLKTKWWDIECTDNHRWLVEKRYISEGLRKHKEVYVEAKDLNTECNIINAKPYIGGSCNINEDEAALIGWILSDGYLSWSEESSSPSTSNGKKRGVSCSIAQSKKKFYNEVKDLLHKLGADYNEYENNNGVSVFSFRSAWVRNFFDSLGVERGSKHEINWSSYILRMPIYSIRAFFDAFVKADGTKHSENKITVYQNKGLIADAVELCGTLLGYRITKSSKDNYCTMRFNTANKTSGQKLVKTFSRKTDVFCLTVPTSNFVIRQNGTITITGNCTYGAGAAKISETTEMPLKDAKKLHAGYHELNWAVKKFAQTRKVKTVQGTNWRRLHKKAGGLQQTETSDWIWNEYSNMWLFLKNDKDRFSACNQNFGVKVFDIWAYFLMEEGIKFSGEWHDEELWMCLDTPEEIERHKQIIARSIEKVNKYFNPPIPIECDYKVGYTYADVH